MGGSFWGFVVRYPRSIISGKQQEEEVVCTGTFLYEKTLSGDIKCGKRESFSARSDLTFFVDAVMMIDDDFTLPVRRMMKMAK